MDHHVLVTWDGLVVTIIDDIGIPIILCDNWQAHDLAPSNAFSKKKKKKKLHQMRSTVLIIGLLTKFENSVKFSGSELWCGFFWFKQNV